MSRNMEIKPSLNLGVCYLALISTSSYHQLEGNTGLFYLGARNGVESCPLVYHSGVPKPVVRIENVAKVVKTFGYCIRLNDNAPHLLGGRIPEAGFATTSAGQDPQLHATFGWLRPVRPVLRWEVWHFREHARRENS